MIDILIGVLEQGLIYGIMTLGLYITYVILNFPDLTVDGSFPLGSAICAAMISQGYHPVLALLVAFIAGGIAGALTGVIHVKFGIRDLISGIIMMTGLYTVNLYIAGQSNLSIFQAQSIFNNDLISSLPDSLQNVAVLLVTIPIVFLCKLCLNQYLKSKSGLLLRSTGSNANLVKTMARDPGNMKILGLAIANALVALSGAVLAQQQRFFDASQGTGTMVIGLASVIIGLKIFEKAHFISGPSKTVLGSIVYKAIVAIAIAMGLTANSLKLITALLLLVILVLGQKKAGGKVKNIQTGEGVKNA